MSLIYEPSGKAREYSPLALNLLNGCDHGCTYCYVPKIFARNINYRHNEVKAKIEVIDKLRNEAPKWKHCKQVLLSFTTDPYTTYDKEIEITRQALEILLQNKIAVAVLTKGGTRCLRDMDIFKKFENHIKVGATLTFENNLESLEIESGAALPSDRMAAIKELHENGIRTWVSFEPVIDPTQTLELITDTIEFVDEYKIGKLNHVKNETDWHKFLIDSVSLLRKYKKEFYVKIDLAAFRGEFYLEPVEIEMDRLCIKSF